MTTMEHTTDGGHTTAEQNGEHAWAEETPRAGQQVQNSLHGLVDELDKLKETLGYNNELQAIEQHLHSLQVENEELRSYAEEAIKEAERLAAVNEELQGRLHQQALDEQMGAVLAETQKLKDVADEFEKDLVFQKLAEAEERLVEIQTLQSRLNEAEEENAALTQTLNEYRESTEQLQRLRLMESGASAQEEVAGSKAAAARDGDASRRKVSGKAASSKKSPVKASSKVSSAGAPSQSSEPTLAKNATSSGAAHQRTESRTEPSYLADQLDVVAGGADTGVVASAAKCLRDYAVLESALASERQETERLRHEVDELRDTMFSKSFKPPSAWAEREVKYKMEKKDWEEKHKELMGRTKQLEQENSEYRAAGKADEFEDRIHDLEAQLLQTQREKDDARAQLHELQINMRAMSDGQDSRFSPYRRGSVRNDAESEGVHNVVAELEKQRIGMEAPSAAESSRASIDDDSDFAVGHAAKSDKLRALAKDRAQADAAWEEHSKKSDVSALRRSKAELETKVSMLEQQIGKMQWAIEHADQEQAAIEEQLDTALQSGDVNKLSGLREKLKIGLASPGKVFRKKGMSPNKMAMSKQLHETTDALRSSEAERNALRRQLAKLSRKYKSMAGVGTVSVGAAAGVASAVAAHDAGEVNIDSGGSQGAGRNASGGAQDGAAATECSTSSSLGKDGEPGKTESSAPASQTAEADAEAAHRMAPAAGDMPTLDEFDTDDLDEFLVPGIDDSEMEVLALREENELLMDQLVSAKVKLAEVEGEFLRSKRELLRSQEKFQQVKERLDHAQQVQRATEQAHEAPLASATPAAALVSSPASFASKAGSTIGEEGSQQMSREVSASSVGGAAEGPAAPAAGVPEKQQKRSKGWIGSLRL